MILLLVILFLFPWPAPCTHRVTCYSTGSVTADGTHIDWAAVDAGEQRLCAVSRELRDEYPYGTIIWVQGKGPFAVHDCTAAWVKDTVDIAYRGPGFCEERKVWIVWRMR